MAGCAFTIDPEVALAARRTVDASLESPP